MSRPVSRLLLVAAVALTLAGCSSPPPTINPGLAIAPLDDIPEDGVLFVPRHDLYLVDSEELGLIALWEKDPHRGCRIAYLGRLELRIDNVLVNHDETRFVDPCHGSEYDGDGIYIDGPSPRSMDRFALDVIGGIVYFESGVPIRVTRSGENE